MARAPFLIVEGDPSDFDIVILWFKSLNFSIITSLQTTSRTFDDYLNIFHNALSIANKGTPTVILGSWLTDQMTWNLAGNELSLSLAGRIMDRLANRYMVQRILLVPAIHTMPEETGLLTSALSGNPIDPYTIPEHDDVRMTYLGHLLAFQLNQVPGWTMANTPDDLEGALRLNRLTRTQAPSWVWEKQKSWYGVLDPKLIICGDKFNPRGHPYPYPFGKHTDSSVYLNTAINIAGLQEQNLAFININDPGGDEHLVRIFQRYVHSGLPAMRHPPAIVALGGDAHLTLNRLGYQHMEFPHPQFVRRFHHEHLMEYAQMFMQFRNII